MPTLLPARCDACSHPARQHHRRSCEGRYIQPVRFTSISCACTNPRGLRKHRRHRRRTAWRDFTVSAATVQTIGLNSLFATLILATIWYLEVF